MVGYCTGFPGIYGRQPLYFEDKTFSAHAAEPPNPQRFTGLPYPMNPDGTLERQLAKLRKDLGEFFGGRAHPDSVEVVLNADGTLLAGTARPTVRDDRDNERLLPYRTNG